MKPDIAPHAVGPAIIIAMPRLSKALGLSSMIPILQYIFLTSQEKLQRRC